MPMIERGIETAAGKLSLTAASCLLDAMSDPTRLRIVQHLLLGEHRVVELTSHLGLAQSTVSGHLACLRGCGLVDSTADGRSSVYRLQHVREVTEVLVSIERLLQATGSASSLCPIHLQTHEAPAS